MAVRSEDDYMTNSTWVARIKGFFDRMDQNKNGTIEVADFEILMDNLDRERKQTDPTVCENFRRVVMDEHLVNMGITAGKKLTKDEYVKSMAKMAVAEHGKRIRGEKMSLEKVNNAMFDLFDINHDGTVSLSEFKTMMNIAYDCDAEEAEATFHKIDANKNGKIEREELTDYELRFWFDLDDEGSKGFYGAKFN